MNIAIDTNALYTSAAGVARYIQGLKRGFAEIGGDNTYHDVAWPVYNLAYNQPARALKTVYREIFWAPLLAGKLLQRNEIQLFHTTAAPLIAPPKHIKHVITLHDLAAVRHPARFRLWQRITTRQRYDQLANADRILCISEFTAREAMQLLGIPAAKIDVVYNGSNFHAYDSPVEQAPDISLPTEFFLFVGSLEPGKNLTLLRAVYTCAEANNLNLPPLVIVGARWQGVAGEGVPPKNWYYLGRQPDEVLVYLYKRAIALLFPSKYEGFGLPVVEAMALGCPVICSAVASLPEVGGDAVLFVDLTPSAYYDAMLFISRNQDIRANLVQMGKLQSQKFNWRKCAEETLQVYQRALN